jgi:NitT/TauT family transport system ATP-binding protein
MEGAKSCLRPRDPWLFGTSLELPRFSFQTHETEDMAIARVSPLHEKAAVAARLPATADQAGDYLNARQVSIAYAGRGGAMVLAIDRVDLALAREEFVCLLGPSGCGKTTFLNAVAGFLPVSSGELTFEGRPVARPGPDRAMVFQQPGLLPWRDVLHNVTYGLEMSGRMRGRAAAAHARSLLELVGLADFARSFPNQLSGGMQQRVNLARALAVEPQLLLLDEPFASVDAQTREALQVELLAICKRAEVTALFVTHDIGEAVFLADRVCIFSRRPGRIVREVRVRLPKPRDEVRLKPEFLANVREVAGVLAAAGTAQKTEDNL